jgi:hypothetical protein
MLIIYIHGFLSSPQSFKAQQVQAFCARQNPVIEYSCPALPVHPNAAIAILEEILEANTHQPAGLIGSSMGGYYATYLSEHHQLPAVLVNPAVKPYLLMENYLDRDLLNYHTEEVSRLTTQHVQELRDLEINSLQCADRLWLLAQTGDETLDYRLAVEKYQACKMTVEEGGDHSFQHFERWLPDIFTFFNSRLETSH